MAATSNATPGPKSVRCAIYTRKSTDDGLNREFNSLDAQREAAEAYILSQRHEGWTLVPSQYSDGGYTGANIERPGVRQLLADIQAGKIDCVVVYKVDRLSRSLIDFAKMMELFEKHGVCFVSVTQQFNTNAPLGRLTLNILLSFAQFEREIISERTRDKQVAAGKKGKWTGGHILLGYDLDSRIGKLTVNREEAERVREMFRLYLEGTSVLEIVQRFDKLGWRNKQWTTQDGKLYGGSPLRRCHIYKQLGNILYTGRVKVGNEIFLGEHEAIVDHRTFELAQARLNENAWKSGNPHRMKMDALLRGMIYCSCCGSGMYSTYSGHKERRYRYYVCYRSQQKVEGYCTTRAVSGPSVEEAVVESIRRVGVQPKVLAETARLARHRLAELISGLRVELNATNGRVKNLKSQMARIRNPETARLTEIREQLASGAERTEELRDAVDAAATLVFRGFNLDALLLGGGREKAPHAVGLPCDRLHDFGQGCALCPPNHLQHLGALGFSTGRSGLAFGFGGLSVGVGGLLRLAGFGSFVALVRALFRNGGGLFGGFYVCHSRFSFSALLFAHDDSSLRSPRNAR